RSRAVSAWSRRAHPCRCPCQPRSPARRRSPASAMRRGPRASVLVSPPEARARPAARTNGASARKSEHEARALSPSRRFLGLEHEVALILAETSVAGEAYPKVLATVGSSLDWDFGAAWEERLDLSGFVRCAATWCSDERGLAD